MGQNVIRNTNSRTRRAHRAPIRVSWIALLGSLTLAGCASVSEPGIPTDPLPQAPQSGLGGNPLQNSVIHPGAEEDSIAAVAYWASRYERQPHKPKHAIRYSEALRGLKSYDRAMELMRQAVAMHPGEPRILGEYGKVLASAGRGEHAIATLERAAALDPSDWRLQSALGVALDQSSEHRQAQKRYRMGLKISPRNPAILNNLGLSHALDGDLAEAELVLRQAVGRAEATAQVRENLALVLRLKGDLSGARSLATAREAPVIESAFAPKLRATLSRAPAAAPRAPELAPAAAPSCARKSWWSALFVDVPPRVTSTLAVCPAPSVTPPTPASSVFTLTSGCSSLPSSFWMASMDPRTSARMIRFSVTTSSGLPSLPSSSNLMKSMKLTELTTPERSFSRARCSRCSAISRALAMSSTT